jgi:hypothetical protein
MNLSVLIARRVRPRTHFLRQTISAHPLIVCIVMVTCFVLPPQMSSVDDGKEEFIPPVVAFVTRTSPISFPRKDQEQAGRANRVGTPRVWADKGAQTLECNMGAQEGRSILNSLCLLRC